MEIVFEPGFAVEKDVELAVNSANGFLLLGTGGAGRIRESSRKLNPDERKELSELLARLPAKTKKFYERLYGQNNWTYTRAQLSCLKMLLNREKNEFAIGEAVLDESWPGEHGKKLVHAIAMSYELLDESEKRIKGTASSIKKALRSALVIAVKEKATSVAFPVFCARKGYGIFPSESFKAILEVLGEFKDSLIGKAVICFDNAETKEYLESLKKQWKNRKL